jgi:hypothetical protein
MSCIYYYNTNVDEPLCLGAHFKNGDGEIETEKCEDMIARGKCPKGKKVL